jgi:predicted nuclease with TOPRIM domain
MVQEAIDKTKKKTSSLGIQCNLSSTKLIRETEKKLIEAKKFYFKELKEVKKKMNQLENEKKIFLDDEKRLKNQINQLRNQVETLTENNKLSDQKIKKHVKEKKEFQMNNLNYIEKIKFCDFVIEKGLHKDKQVMDIILTVKQKYDSLLVFLNKLKEVV